MEGNIDELINKLNDMGKIVKEEMNKPLMIAGEIVRANIYCERSQISTLSTIRIQI